MKRINSMSMFQQYDMIPAPAKISKIRIKNKNFIFDQNSMELYEIEENEKIEGVDTVPYFKRPEEQPEKHICFQATYACNLKCRYCFVENHYIDHKNTLTEEEHYWAIRKFQPSGKFRMGWFGGEPLLNWGVIFKVVESVTRETDERRKNDPQFPIPEFHVTTNGCLLTEEIADYLVSKNFSFIISLDGPREIHDHNRPTALDGTGSFEETMRGLRYLAMAFKRQNKMNNITLRATFDTENPQILETTRFLNSLMYQGLASHVSVEPATLGEGCTIGKGSRIEKQSISEIRKIFENQYVETAEWFLNEIKEGRKPSLHHFEMPLQRLIDREYAISECGAGLGYISVGPGRKICACHREHKTFLGIDEIDPTLQAKWLDNRFYVRDICPTCWKKSICGGGCKVNSLLIEKDISKPSAVDCVLKEIQFREAIFILSEITEKQKKMYSKKRPRIFQQFPMPNQKKKCECQECKNEK